MADERPPILAQLTIEFCETGPSCKLWTNNSDDLWYSCTGNIT